MTINNNNAMKRFYLFLLVALSLFISPVLAQQPAPQAAEEFTLEKCISYALEHSPTYKNATIDEEIAKSKVQETVGIGLPQISGAVTVQHNQTLPRFFATKRTAAGFAGVASEEDYQNFMPGVADNDVIALQNFFQLKSSGSANVTINQLLFNGSYLVGLKASDTYRQLSIKAAVQTKQGIIEQVTKAYYSAIVNKERIKLFDANIGRVDSLLKTTKALNENGFTESIDVDRIRVTLNNLIIERDKFERLQELSLELLKFQINYPMENPITVVGEIAQFKVEDDYLDKLDDNWSYKNRIEYSMLETQRELQRLNVKNYYAQSMPTLAAFGNLGYMTQSPNIGGLFKTNTNLPSDVPRGMGPDKWYPMTSFGVSLNVPIFSGLQRTKKIQQAKLELQKVENSFTTTKSGIDIEIKQAAAIFENAVQTLRGQRENMTLAENVARVTKIKYEQGVGQNIEVIAAENSLREAQVNFYNAVFDALVAKVDLDKAYGKLVTVPQEN